MENSKKVIKNFNIIKEKIEITADECGRNSEDIKLIVVTKQFSSEMIKPLLDSGHLFFGENRVQEAEEKWPTLLDEYRNAELHMIGHLQTNKVKSAIKIFNSIHTIDRTSLVEKILKFNKEIKRMNEFFVQINFDNEKQKSGVSLDSFDDFIKETNNKINISGLMCIPPKTEDPEIYFAFLKQMAQKINLKKLSMGMSGDFQKAIMLGATHIRVGQAIMGERTYG
ncbi:MAG: YggS family pyridoxal phosphate-dependent enzyme [Pseudomonadota bacterium]|nr:YggS family pyridoxal phosphate-dependent enzyme [Pseudomonadota bacterium]MEC9458607.1 YggS family pyridoxal phosphate-dependent enzyme [Pseudomonadota bacterium]